MVGRFAGKVALVTGGGSGIGAATARRLASDGATVGVLDLLPERSKSVAREIDEGGGRAIALSADVADEALMRAAVEKLTREAGALHLVVANAGINGIWAPIDDLKPDEWDQSIRVNLRGCYMTLHLSVPHLKAAGGGAVVIVSSINGNQIASTPGATAYSAAKAGQRAIADQLALELAAHRIRVNTVCPGQTVTGIAANTWQRNAASARFPVEFPKGDIPLTGGKPAGAADVADAISMLLSDDARHVTGATLTVDGGQSLIR